MASRPPLVLGADGLAQQLQAGDDLNPGGWVVYTPTVTIASGSASTTATGRYRKMGTTVLLQVQIVVASVSLGAAGFNVALPLAAAAFRWSIPGEIVGGATVRGTIAASGSSMTLTTYNAGSALAAGTLVLCGLFEAAQA